MKVSVKIIARMVICVVLAGSFLYFYDSYLLPSLTFEEIEKGEISGYESRDTLVIRDDAAWEALWTEMQSIYSHPDDLPEINFTEAFVIAVYRGAFGSNGYSIAITRIVVTIVEYIVYVQESGQGGPLAVMTYPYHVVKILGHPVNLPVKFVFNTA
jgi:hypothetical protein